MEIFIKILRYLRFDFPISKEQNIDSQLIALDQLHDTFIDNFNKLINNVFINEALAKRIIEEIYPDAVKYRSIFTWREYLRFLLRSYKFIGIADLCRMNEKLYPEAVLATVLPYFGLRYKMENLIYKGYLVIHKVNEIDFIVQPGSRLPPFPDIDIPGFLFDKLSYQPKFLQGLLYKEYLWFKSHELKLVDVLSFSLLMNPEIRIFNDMLNDNNYHVLDNEYYGRYSANAYNIKFYSENPYYDKFKRMIEKTEPYRIFFIPEYVDYLYPFIERLAKEQGLTLKDYLNVYHHEYGETEINKYDDDIFISYPITKYLLDKKLITLQGKKKFIDLKANSFNDAPLKLIIYDKYIPAKNAIKKYSDAYSNDPLWPQAKAKLAKYFSDEPKILNLL